MRNKINRDEKAKCRLSRGSRSEI